MRPAMRPTTGTSIRLLAGLLIPAAVLAGTGAPAAADTVYPLGAVKVAMRAGARARMRFRGRWSGSSMLPAPRDALLRIHGGPGDGDTGIVRLPAGAWRPGTRTLRYSDPLAGAGGIRSVVLRAGKKGGTLKIKAKGPRWLYDLDRPQSGVAVALELGDWRACAEVVAREIKSNGPGRLRGAARTAPPGCACLLAGTWDALSQVSLVQHACTQIGCHGSAALSTGNLDLRPGVAYASLVGVRSSADPALRRVDAGAGREASMLWRKLAARTLGLGGVPGGSMPVGDPPFSADELEALALWIEAGAPEDGTVPGTDALLGFCLDGP